MSSGGRIRIHYVVSELRELQCVVGRNATHKDLQELEAPTQFAGCRLTKCGIRVMRLSGDRTLSARCICSGRPRRVSPLACRNPVLRGASAVELYTGSLWSAGGLEVFAADAWPLVALVRSESSPSEVVTLASSRPSI